MMTLAGRNRIVAANALRTLLQQIAAVLGPSIAGLLLANLDIELVFWVDVATFAIVLIALAGIGRHPPADGGRKFGVASIMEGLHFLHGRQVLQGCFVADINAMVLGMPTALFPALGVQHFHGGAQAVGYLYAAPGAGALVAAVFSGWASRVRRQGWAVVIAIFAWGIAIALFGIAPALWLGLVLLAIAGGADVISAVFRGSILQQEVPDQLRGRLSSIHTAVVTGGPRLGNGEAGLVAALAGTQFSVVSGGLGCVLGMGLIAGLMPRFTHYRAPEAPESFDGPLEIADEPNVIEDSTPTA
jgi:MFS family permease